VAGGGAPGGPGRPKKSLEASPQRRALHELASHLHCTVAWLESNISALEFAQWQAWLEAHQVGPRWAALRHAELLAAASNGALRRQDSRPWAVADFLPPDPWAPPPEPAVVASAAAFVGLLPGLGAES
jgi:hypothetical protein